MSTTALFSSSLGHAHHLFDEKPRPKKGPFTPLKFSCSSRHVPVSEPEPPWIVDPPDIAKNPFSVDVPVFDFHVERAGSGIPLSLKIVQLRKKTVKSQRIESAGSAVLSLASVMGEFQRTLQVVEGSCEDTRNGAFKDTSYSVVWLFRKVFYSSPELVVGLLVLMGNFLAMIAVPVLQKTVVDVLKSEVVTSPSFVPRCWSDIGVLDSDEEARMDCGFLDHKRRRMVYEQLIVSGSMDSLILCNYAQLLYQYSNDFQRAHDFFKLAVLAEPADAEAMRRYALFLWHGLGDLEAAEEMFLEAIDAEAENHYYRSSYACFLWKTGGTETCYPLPVADDGIL